MNLESLHKLLLHRVEVTVAFEIVERDFLDVGIALDVVPVDAHEAVHVLVDDTDAQATELDGAIARATAGVGTAGGLDDVGAVLSPRRRDGSASGGRGRQKRAGRHGRVRWMQIRE